MAFSSLFTLIDDIASILDDVAVLTKIAAKKSAGVLGDDLALNAEQVSGIKANRELQVVWKVAKGSFVNKLILVPSALLISYVMPWLILPLLMIGGLYLCFEGVEKVLHSFDKDKPNTDQIITDQEAYEKEKVKGAIRTDLVLSAEIIVITLGSVVAAPFLNKALVLSVISFGMVVCVYGLVAGIIRLDDLGIYLLKDKAMSFFGKMKRYVAEKLIAFTPYLMKTLSFVGTLAMFLVGGGIIIHGVPLLSELAHYIESYFHNVSSILAVSVPIVLNGIVGFLAGLLVLSLVLLYKKLFFKIK